MNPPEIIRRLDRADRAWRQRGAFEHGLRSVKFVCLAALVVVGADLLLQLGAGARVVLGLLCVLAALSLAGVLLHRAFLRQGSRLRIARHLEERDPSLGSKLVNVLQLSEQATDAQKEPLTRALAARAVDEASRELAGHDFAPLVKSPTLRRSAWRAALPVAALVGLCLWFAPIAGREIMRFLDPFGDHPPFSFTHLAIVTPADDATEVVFRRPVTIEAEYAGHRPTELFLEVQNDAEPGPPQVLPMAAQGGRKFVQQIDHVTGNLTVRARTKNGRSQSQARHIAVKLAPQVEKSTLEITPPAYTRLAPRKTTLALGGGTVPAVTALAGSTLRFAITSNRPLSAGRAFLRTSADAPLEVPLTPGTGDARNTATAALAPQESGRLTFDLRDETGLTADRELAAAVTVTHDLPPEVQITEPAQDGFIVENYTARVGVRATDDYGLKTVRVHTGVDDAFADPRVQPAQDDPPPRDMLEGVDISPQALGAKPGQVISVFAEAADIAPETHMARTRTLRLEVITEDAYNELLRLQTEIGDLQAKYDAFHDRVRALADEQRRLAEEAAKAAEAPDGVSEATREALTARQAELNGKLDALAGEMASATREKPLYDLEKDLQKVLDAEAQKIRESVARNEQELASFSGAEPSAESAKQFQQAAAGQADRLDPAAEQAQRQIAQALEDSQKMQELLKSLSAIQQAYEKQQELAAQTAAYRDKPNLTPEDKLSLQNMAAEQRTVGEVLKEAARKLREDADAAAETYPEAADDARKLAEALEEGNFPTLADDSARSMIAGRGKTANDRAMHLRDELAQLMSECGQCRGGMGESYAQRLRLTRGMLAGNTFSQMSQCRNFGLGTNPGMSQGGGGMGLGGRMASGMQNGPQMSLLGGESQLGRPQKESVARSNAQSQGTPSPGAGTSDSTDDPGRGGLTERSRPAGSAAGDAALDEYSDVVDAYFRKLTANPDKP